MSKILSWLSWLVTVRPYITLVVLLIITVVLAAGTTRRAPPTEGADVAFLPPGHAIANATQEIDELFGDSSEVSVVTLLFRGEALTPDGLSQTAALIDDIVRDPSVGQLLVPAGPVVAPSYLVNAVLQVSSFESITQAEIDSVRNVPEIQAALDAMTGTDTDGTPVSIATIRLSDTGDERIGDAERRISELATGDEGPLRVSSLSPVVVEDEYREATETGLAPLIGLALLLINDPAGVDAMLLQFPTYLHEPEQTRKLQEEIEALWFGEDNTITAISESIVSVAVTDQITDRQTEAIGTTVAVALGILAIFFWVTLRQPALGIVAVGPIVLVLICVLGTMALLDIPYTLVTSFITALSIGIGVDYTIHVIHRCREEFAHLRNPERAAIRTLATTGSALSGCDAGAYNAKLYASPRYTLAISAAERANRRFDSG